MIFSRNSSIKIYDENEYSQDESYDIEPYAVYPNDLVQSNRPMLFSQDTQQEAQPLPDKSGFFGTAKKNILYTASDSPSTNNHACSKPNSALFLYCFRYFSLFL